MGKPDIQLKKKKKKTVTHVQVKDIGVTSHLCCKALGLGL